MKPIIEVKNLTKSYKLKTAPNQLFEAVKGISFTVEEGEIFGILGPNGAGKTTTLEIIETLRPKTGGEVKVLGLGVATHKQEIKKQIGIQLQSSNYVAALTLNELLHLFSSLYGQTVNPGELLKLVSLEEKASAQVKELSGGQKQRFTIATSLVNNPKILFLDEPTTGLDPRARRDIWELIKSINKKGVTIVMTTHYMEEAEFLCDRVAILDHGKILTISHPKTLVENLKNTTQVTFLMREEVVVDWSGIAEIQKVYSSHPKTILEITNLSAVGKIIELLEKENISFSSFTVKTATLEDVYLDLTGKEYESE